MEKTKRPWGEYEVIEKRKIIRVKPYQQLSTQYHLYRDEHWTITKGSGLVNIAKETFAAIPNDTYYIPRNAIHSVKAGEDGLEFIEIATGLVDEDDIIRLEDKYGRV